MSEHEAVRAARLVEHGKPLEVEEVGALRHGRGEVRVRLAFAGVNPVDRYMAEGRVAPDGPLPRTLGGEASGTLEGRPVLVSGSGLGARRDGVWATEVVVPESAVVALPDGVGMQEAAAAAVAGLTAWNIAEMASVGPDDRVLVLGASGGVGLTVVSLAASRGATVWGQTGHRDKDAAIRRQGADHVVVADAVSLGDALGDVAPTVVLDPLGSSFTQAALASLAPGGRLVLFGTSAGPEGTVHLQNLYRNGLRVLGYAGLRLSDDERRSGLRSALGALADGRMRIPVDRVLPLAAVNEALELFSERPLAGKVLLDLS